MHPLSLAALTVLELSPDEQILCAEKTGYQGVGLRLIPATPTEIHYSLISDAVRRAKVKQLISSTGLKVFDIEIFRLKPDTQLNDYLPFIELGAELGSKNMLVAGNDSDWSRMTDNWLALCELVKQFDIKPHIEPMPWTDIKSYLDGIEFIDAASPDMGAVLIDPIHFFRTGGDPNQISDHHAQKMGYVQFADAPMPTPHSMDEILRQAREDRLPPGEGDFPLVELLQKLPNDLPISVEIPLAPRWGCSTAEQKANLVRSYTLKLLEK